MCDLRTTSILLWAALACGAPALAQTGAPPPPPSTAAPAAGPPVAPAPYPRIAVGTQTFLQYDVELDNRDGYNAFDLTRGYINIAGDLAKHVRFRLTPDLRRVSDGSMAGSLQFRLKYGFVQFDELTPRSSLQFGALPTPWIDFEQTINRYRVQGTMFAERVGVIPGSGDFGVSYLTQLPGNYGEITGGIFNGEGYAQAEADEHKSVQARVTVRPWPRSGLARGIRISAFYDAGWYADDRPRRHGILMASYEQPRLAATIQWLAGTARPEPRVVAADLRGYSLFAEVRQGLRGWAGFARFDAFDPDRATRDNSEHRSIVGAANWLYWSDVRLGLVMNAEWVRYNPGRRRPDERRLLFQTHVQF